VAGGGSLRTYLGIAPGVGKTFAMLAEGRRRAENGERVVVGWIESHGRPQTSSQLGGLEVIAPRAVAYRGAVFADFDAPAAIASGAEVVLVDELAHSTADRTRQRWQDVADVLRAGPDVVTTVNVAHLRSVRDYAARVTGVGSVACVPDEFVRAGEVVLVDLPAEALRQRIASGAVYSAGQLGGALADYFRAANLPALSELAPAWMAGTAEVVGEDLLARRGPAGPPAPPVVVAGDSGSSWGEMVIRRAAQLARAEDAQLLVVHVQVSDGLARPPAGDLDRHRELTADLGGTYTQVQGHAPAQALAEAARAQGAATVVDGQGRHARYRTRRHQRSVVVELVLWDSLRTAERGLCSACDMAGHRFHFQGCGTATQDDRPGLDAPSPSPGAGPPASTTGAASQENEPGARCHWAISPYGPEVNSRAASAGSVPAGHSPAAMPAATRFSSCSSRTWPATVAAAARRTRRGERRSASGSTATSAFMRLASPQSHCSRRTMNSACLLSKYR
jgi:Osmosensitive K+ channel His kinase sensor domain